MKPILFRVMLVLAASAVVPECWAADTAGGNAFLDAKLGYVYGRQDSGYSNVTHTSWGADGGYLWKSGDAVSAGFEAGYMQFGHLADYFGNSGGTHLSASAITLGGHIQGLLGEERATILQARVGLLQARITDDFTSNFGSPSTGSDSWNESGIYFGVGIGRKLTQGLSVLLAFNLFTLNGSTQQRSFNTTLHWIGLEGQYEF